MRTPAIVRRVARVTLGPVDAPDDRRAETLAAHEQAMRQGEDGYTDPETGLFVFTAAYLAARGTCCESDCRHCPYVR
jgi:hypothetical protein